MKNLFTVMKFTMKEMIRKKSFIIATLLIIVLIIVGFSIPKIIKTMKAEEGTKKVLISDKDNVYEGTLESLNSMGLPYDITINNATSFDEIKKKIENSEISTSIIIEKENEQIKLKYIVENMIWEREIPEDLFKALNSVYTNLQMTKLGITPEQLQELTPKFDLSVEQTKEKTFETQNIFLMVFVSVGLSVAIIFFTAQVSQSITTEKTSKIMETLVTSTSPRTIVLGKTIGVGIIGLFQVLIIAITAIICANIFLDSEMMSMFDISKITPAFAGTTIVYFVFGFFAYALLYALTGSLVTKPEDIQSANTPISMIAMVGFYLGYFSILIDPTSSLSQIAGIIPISSPFCMPARFMMGLATPGELAISIVLLLAIVAIIAKVAINVYSNAILNYGSKMSIKDALRMYKQK